MSSRSFEGPDKKVLEPEDGLTSLKSAIQSVSVASNSSQEPSCDDALLEERVLESIKGDNFRIDWLGPDDKGSPQNLPYWRKWLITVSLAMYALSTTFASSVYGAATHAIAEEFHLSAETVVLGCTSLYMVGFAMGPTLWGFVYLMRYRSGQILTSTDH